MINEFSILNHKKKKIDWMAQYLTKKKSLCRHYHEKLYVDKIGLDIKDLIDSLTFCNGRLAIC
jgi:hypothetical protein